MPYNPITCAGWSDATAGWVATGDCIGARIGVVILFFLFALIRKWGGEEMGINFSFWLALPVGLVAYLITVILFGQFKIAFAVGLVAGIVMGYGAGLFGLGESDE